MLKRPPKRKPSTEICSATQCIPRFGGGGGYLLTRGLLAIACLVVGTSQDAFCTPLRPSLLLQPLCVFNKTSVACSQNGIWAAQGVNYSLFGLVPPLLRCGLAPAQSQRKTACISSPDLHRTAGFRGHGAKSACRGRTKDTIAIGPGSSQSEFRGGLGQRESPGRTSETRM